MADISSTRLTHNARIGMILFVIYLLFYGSFVWVSAFRNEWMAQVVWAGLNLAIVWGMALIGVAVIMAIIYILLARDDK